MSKQTELKKEISSKSDQELRTMVNEARETLRSERFKDKFSRKAGLIRAEKHKIARSLTELNARSKNQDSR